MYISRDRMDKSYFIKLLQKYERGTASIEECKFLLEYYDRFDSDPDILVVLSAEEKQKLKMQIQDDIWSDIYRVEKENIRKFFWIRVIKNVAAAAIILLICAIGLFYFGRYSSPENRIQKSSIVKTEGVVKHRLIRLPDGSTVILYAGSKLNYPSSFDGFEKREVYLDGEAYFDIKHNDEKAFIVHAGKLETTVLGTAFNVKAWPEEADISITVARGKVRVDDNMKQTIGIVTLNEQLTYNKKEAEAVQHNVNTETFTAWKEGDLLFDDVTIAEASELLEERFNVEITCTDDLVKSKRFTTTFLKNESLEQVLKSICAFNDAYYQYDKEKSIVTIHNNNKPNDAVIYENLK